MSTGQEFAFECLLMMLRPIARYCIKNSLSVRELLEAAKVALIEAAQEDLTSAGQKVNVSRLAVTTGIHRRDVMRLTSEAGRSQPLSRAARVVGQWEQDKRFQNAAGKPRVLNDEEFAELVYLFSRDLNAGTVLFQLERVGAVERTKAGLRLIKKAFSVHDDAREAFLLLARDMQDLGSVVNENLSGALEHPHLHARTEYDNVFQSSIPALRRWLLEEGSAFHGRLRRFLSKHDRDVNPSRKGEAGARVVVSTFSRIVEGGKRHDDN